MELALEAGRIPYQGCHWGADVATLASLAEQVTEGWVFLGPADGLVYAARELLIRAVEGVEVEHG